LIKLKVSLDTLHFEKVALDTASPTRPSHSPAALHRLDIEALAAPAEHTREIAMSSIHHFHGFIVDFPTHSFASA